MKKQRLRASAVVEAEGKLLLVRLRDPVSGVEALYPPGGAVEPDERPEETARRETLEETGVRIRVDSATVFVDRYPFTWADVDYDVTTHFFVAQPEESPAVELPEVVDADYHLGAAWVPMSEALDALAVHPRIASAVTQVLHRARVVEWRRHPNLAGPASMLLTIHEQLRRAAAHVARLEEPDAAARAFAPLATVLHHHHRAEEVLLFPLVERRIGGAPARLVRDHESLAGAVAAVEATGTKEALARFTTVLTEHLDREELVVIPVLLSLEPEEAMAMLEGAL